MNETDYWQAYSLLCSINSLLYSEDDISGVDMSPPKECRQKYGGNLTDEQYQQIVFGDVNNIIADVYHLPIYPVKLHMYQINKNLNINTVMTGMGNKTTVKQKVSMPVDLNSAKKSGELIKSMIKVKLPTKENHF